MANRLTKGKALVGSLDVQGELTINGAPVGAGGSSGTPLVYTMYRDPQNMMNESWGSMGAFQITNNNGMMTNRPERQQNFLANNNIVPGDVFDITAEYQPYDMMSGTYGEWQSTRLNSELAGYNLYGVCIYSPMNMENTILCGRYGDATYSMMGLGTLRLTLRKKG